MTIDVNFSGQLINVSQIAADEANEDEANCKLSNVQFLMFGYKR